MDIGHEFHAPMPDFLPPEEWERDGNGAIHIPAGFRAVPAEPAPVDPDVFRETEAQRQFVAAKEERRRFGRFQTLDGPHGVLTRLMERLGLEYDENGRAHYPAKGILVEWPATAAGDD